jgi:hypothetical protein
VVGDGEGVDGLGSGVEVDDGVEDLLVAGVVEVAALEGLGGLVAGFGVAEHGAEEGAFGEVPGSALGCGVVVLGCWCFELGWFGVSVVVDVDDVVAAVLVGHRSTP